MRSLPRIASLCALCAALAAGAQDEPAAPAETPPAPEAPPASPVPEAHPPEPGEPEPPPKPRQRKAPPPEAPPTSAAEDVQAVADEARSFFAHLISGDARALVGHAALPFLLEGRRITGREELLGEWLKNLRGKRTDLLVLYDIEVLTPAEMEKKYGKPPARLSGWPARSGRTYFAVANLSGHGAVVLFRQEEGQWRAAAYHD